MTTVASSEITSLLKGDLASFADPGTAVELDTASAWVAAVWYEDGRRKTAEVKLGTDPALRDVLVRTTPDGSEVPYATFLAGERMGDLKGLARNTLSVVADVPAYVAPRALSESGATPMPADELVDGLASVAADETAVVFVTAEAGVGKTSLLVHLVRAKAEGYLLGEEKALWLYVNAQGSRLARLDQALAATLDDLRAGFPYHATTALVRSGALVLVIDGFDELIGTQGTYDEAFSSLASFIEDLRGAGSIVAAARSAYYEQEFAARADSTIGFRTDRWSLRTVALCDWNASERGVFLDRLTAERAASPAAAADLRQRVEAIFNDGSLGELAGKPLFVTRVANLIADGVELEAGDDLVHRLITTYLRREANEKLLSPRGTPLLSVAQLADFYTEIANEMWRQEARELSRTSLRELVEILADLHGLDDDARLTVIERTPYAAVMRTGTAPGSVSFEHELYFSYFLAQPTLDALRSREPLTIARALRKGRLPSQTGFLAGRGLDVDDVQPTIDSLLQASRAMSTGGEQIRENGGLIVAGALYGRPAERLRIASIDFNDCDLTRLDVSHCSLVGCAFRGADLRGAQFRACDSEDVLMESVVVDSSTRLEIDGLPVEHFLGLILASDDGSRSTLYSPDELHAALASLGLPAADHEPEVRTINPRALELVSLLSRIYERTNLATPDDDNVMRHVVQDPMWELVHSTLSDANIIRDEKRSAGGNKIFMRMLVRPRDLLAGQAPNAEVDPRISRFWQLLEERAPGEVTAA